MYLPGPSHIALGTVANQVEPSRYFGWHLGLWQLVGGWREREDLEIDEEYGPHASRALVMVLDMYWSPQVGMV